MQALQKQRQPLVSIVTATYNSSHLLKFAIGSVLQSTIDDWELIIIGDHCTDDTEQVVQAFNEDRIQFHNLAKNSGQQATPNNLGVSKAAGKYLCFLNQDDMFFPEHLESMINELQRREADIICARYAIIQPFDPKQLPVKLTATNGGPVFDDSQYHPVRWYIASSWFMLRRTAVEVGSWKQESDTFVTPSQEWLFRASRNGQRVFCNHTISLVALSSGARKGSYRERISAEHEYVFGLMKTDDFPRKLAASVEMNENDLEKTLLRRFRRLYCFLFEGILKKIGIHPAAPEMIVRFGGKGGYVRHWKKKTG